MNSIQRAAFLLAITTLGACSESSSPSALRPNGLASLERSPAFRIVDTSVYATGLNNPRGLRFGPDGSLYVAEGGVGGTTLTVGQCKQVPPPVGPYTGSVTGSRISKIDHHGTRTTVVGNLPSSATSAMSGALTSGVADVEFVDGTLYGLLTGAGCSHGVPSVPNQVFRVGRDGTKHMIANLTAWYQTHPTAKPEEDDFEPDGTPYSMVAVRGALYVVEPNHGSLERVDLNGRIQRVTDISAREGHIVPTTVSYHGDFFVGNLSTFPVDPGSAKILKVTPSGNIKTWVTGLTAVTGSTWDDRGRLYVLENTTVAGMPTPMTGRIRRIDPSGAVTTIVEGLFLPTAMTMGPDGALYVSNVGFGAPPIGLGEVLRVRLRD